MKGIFTQGLVVLTRTPVAVEDLQQYLPEFPFTKITPPSGPWEFGAATAVVSFRPEANGGVLIDAVDHPWPDHMGDPKKDVTLFGAWSMGNFGPLTFPGGLKRAIEQSWSWQEARQEVPRHTGFVRIRLSYSIGAAPDAKVLPADYDARAELDFLMEIARCVLRHPAALCYFNPNGEVVALPARVEETLAYHREHELPPLSLWANVRLFNLPDGWLAMDSVGNGQLDLPDLEAVFPKGAFQPGDVDYFIRNATLYLLSKGLVIEDGHTMDGPGDIPWRATTYKEGITSPPREVMCWVPTTAKGIPAGVSQRPRVAGASGNKKGTGKRPWWKPWK